MRILGYILVVLFVTTSAMGQQINPVPDYIFRNQMSVGRNAPTDTAAYLSVGPRYGANKGLMPPMVVDTNAVTGTKRNGLLIFSVQLNNFAYWDSTTSRFRQITAQATVDSLVFATRAWRKKGDDSLGAVIAVKTDTALLSTKAYRQKAVDSLVTLISTLGGGTVLSVSAGTGMNFTTITTSGSVSADTSVLSTRAWRKKGDDSLGAVIAGKVNISDTSTMLSAYLRKADTTAMLSPYLRKGDTTAMLSPYVRAAGFGLTKGTQSLSVDSALMATRARVQKGIDSVASLVAAPDSLLFSTRAWRQKGDDSLGAIIATKATATGTTNYLSKFTGTSSLGNSIVYATTSEVGISTPSPTHPLDVNGRVRVRTIDSTATGMNMLYADVDGVIKKAAIPAGGSGTVTSVAAGTGMNFSTITTTGSVSADTVALSTRAWRQKGIDSVAGLSRVTGSGVSGQVSYWNGTSSQAGENAFFWDATNDRLGLGTTAPLFTVDARSDVATIIRLKGGTDNSEGASLFYTFAGSGATFMAIGDRASALGGKTDSLASIFTGTNIPLLFDISGSERMRLKADGELLIGTTTDAGAYALQVAGSIYNTTGAVFAASSGNVGVGTTSASEKLHVSGTAPNVRVSNAGNTIYVNHASDGIYSVGGPLTLFAPTSQPLILSSGNGEASRFTADKEMLINTTTDAGDYRLQVAGAIYNTTGAVFAASSGNVLIGTTTAETNTPFHATRNTNTAATFLFSNPNTGTGAFTDLEVRNNSTPASGMRIMAMGSGWTTTQGFVQSAGIVNADGSMTGGMSIMTRANAPIRFYTNGANNERLRITETGNVGIGTTTPSESLHVNGRARIATIDSSAGPINMLWADVNGVVRKAAVPSGGGGTVTSVAAGTGMSFTTITTTGSVAVDTVSIATRARVYKTIDSMKVAGYTNLYNSNGTLTGNRVISKNGSNLTLSGDVGEFRVENAAGTTRVAVTNDAIIATGTSLTLFAPSAQSLILSSGNGEAGRFNPDKEFLIGTSSDAGDYKLQVNGNGYVSGRMNIASVDSFSTAQNMLFVDNDGRIKKAAVPSGGGGGVTSVATGFGIDGGTITSTGTLTSDTVEMATRARVQKGIDSVAGLARVTGSGTANYFPYWTGTTALGNSEMYQLNSEVLIGYTADQGTHKLQVNGNTFTNGSIKTAAPSGGTAAEWKLGTRVASSVGFDGTQYIEVDIGGTSYYLATVSFLEPKPKPKPNP